MPSAQAYQTVSYSNGTECLASQVSTDKTGGLIFGASAYDYDQEVVYHCGGVLPNNDISGKWSYLSNLVFFYFCASVCILLKNKELSGKNGKENGDIFGLLLLPLGF